MCSGAAAREVALARARLGPFCRTLLGALPAAAEGAVEEDVGQELVADGAGEVDFRVEVDALAVEDLEVGRDASEVAIVLKGELVAQGLFEILAPLARLADLLAPDQGVGDLAEGQLHRLHVGQGRLALL